MSDLPDVIETDVMSIAPADVIAGAQTQAQALMNVVERQGLFQLIRGRKFLQVEAWQLLAAFVGLSPRIESTSRVEYDAVHGWEARAVVVDRAGQEAAAGEAMCLSDEPNWRGKPEYQLRSMAQTRAVSKALRNKLAFVAVLAGYAPTPAEEMDGVRASAVQAEPNRNPKPEPKPETKPPLDPNEGYDAQAIMKWLCGTHGTDWVRARYDVFKEVMSLEHWSSWDEATMVEFVSRLEIVAGKEQKAREEEAARAELPAPPPE